MEDEERRALILGWCIEWVSTVHDSSSCECMDAYGRPLSSTAVTVILLHASCSGGLGA